MTLLLLLLDLAAAHAAPPANAMLSLEMSAPKVMTAGTMTPVRVTLRNLGSRPVRVVSEACNGPFAVVVDGKTGPGVGCDRSLTRTVELLPGASTASEVLVALSKGRHQIAARYEADEREAFRGPLVSESQSVKVNAAVMEIDY